jgi:hypothetical protein
MIIDLLNRIKSLRKFTKTEKQNMENTDSYNCNFRENNPIYLIRQSQELMIIAKSQKNSNAIIYACLDTRIALELLDMNKILLSIEPDEVELILQESKPKNGIERVGKKTGTLKEKYQLYFQAICEIVDLDAKSYNFKESKNLQHKLSTYIHSYYMMPDEINFDSVTMQNAFKIITNSHTFIKSSVHLNDNEYESYGIRIKKLSDEDKTILNDWKNSNISYDELKEKLKDLNSKTLK